MKKNNEVKLTLEEYQQKYAPTEVRAVTRNFFFLFTAGLGVVIGVALFFIVLRLYEIHNLAGHISVGVAVLLFIFLYLVPVIRLQKTPSFTTSVTNVSAKGAQKHNKKMREDIADKMIDMVAKTDVVGWYSNDNVGRLAVARHTRNDQELKAVLSLIYKTDVRSAANKMIRNSALKVGFATAVSQSETVDTLFSVLYQLNLIKDIVYLYGYRPNDAQMAKIYKNVFINAVIAYGVSNATAGIGKSFGAGVANALDKVSQSSGILASTLASIAGVLVESGVQFGVNSTLTVIIGNQTKRYLVKEYKLQDVLDTVEILDSVEEEAKLLQAVRRELKSGQNSATKKKKEPAAA